MKKPDNGLLIGNGLNRCLKKEGSWNDLLEAMAKKYDVTYNGNIPLPMEFESIVNQCQMKCGKRASDRIYLEMKEEIAEKLKKMELPNDSVHKELKRLNLDLVMTTNYDCLLERVFDRDYSFRGGEKIVNKKYLYSATAEINGVKFYHPHGIAELPKTLCLGYEHYMGIVTNLREKINTKLNNKPGNMKIKQVLFGERSPDDEWGEKFYTANVGIIGLELSAYESDLWWLITHRAFLYYSNYEGVRERLVNKVVYFDIINENKRPGDSKRAVTGRKAQQEARHRLLKNEHVIVRTYVVGEEGFKSYEKAYMAMIEHIEKEGLERLEELKEYRG